MVDKPLLPTGTQGLRDEWNRVARDMAGLKKLGQNLAEAYRQSNGRDSASSKTFDEFLRNAGQGTNPNDPDPESH